jgi:hypothetical protein
MPYGAYDRFAVMSCMSDAGQETAIALEAAIGDKFVFTVLEACVVFEFRCLATVTMNYDTQTAACMVSLDKRPAYGSDTNRTELGVLTIPNGLAAGKAVYKKITPEKLLPGQQVVVEVKQAGTGGAGIAGDWRPVLISAPVPESPGMCTNLVATA